MSEHAATVAWERRGQVFTDGRYARRHVWRFDGGAEIAASASPQVVPPPYSDPTAVDPEEAFAASLASCHMLWFLSLAAKEGFVADRYEDTAAALLAPNAAGRKAIVRVTLRPWVEFDGERLPTWDDVLRLHAAAHEECFLAASVNCEIRCEPIST